MQIKKALFIFCLLPQIAFAQVDSLKRKDFNRFTDGVAYTFTAPARWHQQDFLKLAGLLSGAALLTLVDEPIRDFWDGQESQLLNGVERAGYHYGKPYSALIIASGFYITGVIEKSDWAKDTGLMLSVAYLCSGSIQTLMKSATGRARPKSEKGVYTFDPFLDDANFHSFPSGHMTLALTSSLILARRVKSPVLKIVFYSAAGVTAIGRMYADQHWFSDVAFGGALAYFCAGTAMNRIATNKFKIMESHSHIKWEIAPSPLGISIRASMK